MKKIRLIAISLAGVSALIASTAIVLAGWCWSDPVIGFKAPGMKEADVTIDVAVPVEMKASVSEVLIVIKHPYNVVPKVKFMDGILPEVVVFQPTNEAWQVGATVKINVAVTVIAPGISEFDIQYQTKHTKKDKTVETIMKSGRSGQAVGHEFGLFVRK